MKLAIRLCLSIASLIISGKSYLAVGQSAKLITPSDPPVRVSNQPLVTAFYKLNYNRLYWFAANDNCLKRRQVLKTSLDSSINAGLDRADYHYNEILENIDNSFPPSDSLHARETDVIFTDALIRYCIDLYSGKGFPAWISADQISGRYREEEDHFILNSLISINNGDSLGYFINNLEPRLNEYLLLKKALAEQLQSADSRKIKQLRASLNQFRWIHHFKFKKFIIVNIPSASLRYYEDDSVLLKMKVVVGKPSTRTPRFAAYCNQIILYPFWNVPRKIAVNELLPIFKRSPSKVDAMNMQIIDSKGQILDPYTINWSSYNRLNFPYQMRQSTGCDNALGVIKFNLTSPFDVYMHDTNFKSAFKSAYRYYSHGCIRLEKPLELANYLLNNHLDSAYLKACLKDQISETLVLDKEVPVFVAYLCAEGDQDQVILFKDIYHLLK